MERRRRTRRIRVSSPDASSSANEVGCMETTTPSTSFATVVVQVPCLTTNMSLAARLMSVMPTEMPAWQRAWQTRPLSGGRTSHCNCPPKERLSTDYWISSVTTACAPNTTECRTTLMYSSGQPSTSSFQQRAKELSYNAGDFRRRRYAADDRPSLVAATSSSRCSFAATIFYAAAVLLGIVIAPSLALPSRKSAYIVDIRQIGWPKAERNKDASGRYTKLDCYTELDRSFVGGGDVYRLYSRKQLPGKSCLLRIPTRTRITFLEPTFRSAFSFARIIAGESQVSMPLATRKIYGESTGSDLGPWHVACSAAYLIFHSAAPTVSARPMVRRRGQTHHHHHHQHHQNHHQHRDDDIHFYGDNIDVAPSNHETVLMDEDAGGDGELNLETTDDDTVESRMDEPTDESDAGEFVEFWLESETAADARDSARADCRAPGVNYAEIENF